MEGHFTPSEERRAIRENVPVAIKPDIEWMETMEDIWKYLDLEYGKPNVLSKECIDYLHNFQYSKAATSKSAKFN